ncbi:MAG: hypothetical protein IJK01_05540 [Clostridia bacterium]|jgi:hypothetical protein|nr:hypothetical protein [Clostridia bacterium]
MKRFGILALLILLCVACAAPGRTETAVFVDPNAVKEGAYGDLAFVANGFAFGIYDPMETVLAHSTSNGSFAEVSCAFEGEDVYYYFSGFEVMANTIDGAERVTMINLTDDTVKTPDGLYIGMPEAEAASVLHAEPDGSIYRTVDGTAQRTVTVQDGRVAAITYLPAE